MPTFKRAPTVRVCVPAGLLSVPVPDGELVKLLTIIVDEGPVRVTSVVGIVIAYVAFGVPVTVKAAAVTVAVSAGNADAVTFVYVGTLAGLTTTVPARVALGITLPKLRLVPAFAMVIGVTMVAVAVAVAVT
jgi:hypothetical protein